MYQSTLSQLPKITLDYLEHGAPEGQRDDSAYKAAQQFKWNEFTFDEAISAIVPRAMADGLSRSQAEKCVKQGYESKPGDPIGRRTPHSRPTKPTPKFKKTKTEPEPLPDSIEDGWVKLLEAAFEPDEYVSIGCGYVSEPDENGEKFQGIDGGFTLRARDWIESLRARKEDADTKVGKILKGSLTYGGLQGLYIRINPVIEDGKENEHVTAFRHALIEADSGSREEQLGALRKIGLPVTAIIDSGGKSVHFWVRIDAKDQKEYAERVELLHQFCKQSLGLDIDQKNKNPSRYSRMPNGNRMRINKETGEPVLGPDGKPIIDMQRLLEVNVPGKPWSEWSEEIQAQQERSYQRFDLDELINFRPADDPDSLIGNR